MPSITFRHLSDLQVPCEQGESIFEIAERIDKPLSSACGAKASCALYQVKILDGEAHLSEFSDAEREALRLARDASLVPSDASEEHFERLRDHFNDGEIVEIVSVISLFGWLNRWNDTMATTLEPAAAEFATENLGASGWEIGAHV